jgi:hypothetical protein
LEPVTVLETVAVNVCPTRWVLVQMREPLLRLIVDPAGMTPARLSEAPPGVVVTVFPLGVVVAGAGVGVRGGWSCVVEWLCVGAWLRAVPVP